METEEKRRERLEKRAATVWLRLAMVIDKRKRKTGEDGSYHTAPVGPGDRGRRKSKE